MIGKDKEYKERRVAASFDRVESIPQEERNLEKLDLSTAALVRSSRLAW